MKHRLKASILLLLFSLTIISQAAKAITYSVSSTEDQIVQFNRAMATNDREITLTYDSDDVDFNKELYERKNSLQDYADSDYAYYNMNTISPSYWSFVSDSTRISYTFNIQGLETPEQTKYVYDTIHTLIKSNSSIIKASDYDKALWAYNYVVNHVVYDTSQDDSLAKFSAYSALHDGKAVCQGYALLYYALTKELGLSCKIVSGEANNGSETGPHAWNAINLGGKWYYVDTTWGAGSRNNKYFLALKKDLTSHTLDSSYENYFDFADTPYVNYGTSQYHGILASVYNVLLDPLKKIKITSVEVFPWLLYNPDQIDLTFTSDNPEVAKVTDDGEILGVSAGTTIIKVVNEDLGIEQKCEVTVSEAEASITGYDHIKVTYHKTAAIHLILTPASAKLKNVSYRSSNATIATVNKQGVVTGKRAGKTTIIVTYGDNHQVKIPVTVAPMVNSKYKSITVKAKKSSSIINAAAVSDKGYLDLIYQSSSAKIAKVSTKGTVTGVKKGNCYIKIYDRKTKQLVTKVTVKVQ